MNQTKQKFALNYDGDTNEDTNGQASPSRNKGGQSNDGQTSNAKQNQTSPTKDKNREPTRSPTKKDKDTIKENPGQTEADTKKAHKESLMYACFNKETLEKSSLTK